MLAVLVTGRLVQTDFIQVSESKFVFNIPEADNVNHIVIFLTGSVAFPPEMGGSVYFSWPCSSGPSWQFLGFISNDKPSAIFKVAGLKKDNESNNISSHPFGVLSNHMSHMMQVGVSVEPLSLINQQTSVQGSQATNASNFDNFCRKMIDNFYNYVTSFSVSRSQVIPSLNENYIPFSTVKNWYEIFRRRLEQNQNFWK